MVWPETQGVRNNKLDEVFHKQWLTVYLSTFVLSIYLSVCNYIYNVCLSFLSFVLYKFFFVISIIRFIKRSIVLYIVCSLFYLSFCYSFYCHSIQAHSVQFAINKYHRFMSSSCRVLIIYCWWIITLFILLLISPANSLLFREIWHCRCFVYVGYQGNRYISDVS